MAITYVIRIKNNINKSIIFIKIKLKQDYIDQQIELHSSSSNEKKILILSFTLESSNQVYLYPWVTENPVIV